jgi:hypothetical protein
MIDKIYYHRALTVVIDLNDIDTRNMSERQKYNWTQFLRVLRNDSKNISQIYK